eukprot:768597-Hanusia_phi.AAC.2
MRWPWSPVSQYTLTRQAKAQCSLGDDQGPSRLGPGVTRGSDRPEAHTYPLQYVDTTLHSVKLTAGAAMERGWECAVVEEEMAIAERPCGASER